MAATPLARLSDRELLSQLQALSRRERLTTIEILKHLNEVEQRRLHVKQGFSSMFDYCTRSLRYSASAAARRIGTARCLRRYPTLEKMLARREVSLSTVALVAPILNDGNNRGLLQRIRGKSQREVEAIAAEFRPPLNLRDRVRPVRVRVAEPVRSSAAQAGARVKSTGYTASGRNENRTSMSDHFRSGSKSAQVTSRQQVGKPQTTIRKKLLVQFLASEAFMKRYEEARALLGHRIPVDAPFEEALGLIIEEFIDRHSPGRKAERRNARAVAAKGTARPGQNTPAPSPRSRHIPAPVRDAVMVRDEGRCTFVAPDGTRCQSRAYLQIDHVKPFSQNGGHDPANLRLLCAAHNRLEAERVLGTDVMKRFRRRE